MAKIPIMAMAIMGKLVSDECKRGPKIEVPGGRAFGSIKQGSSNPTMQLRSLEYPPNTKLQINLKKKKKKKEKPGGGGEEEGGKPEKR